ncbi:hypothetical protein CBM2608_A330013 [Cupriavidus taiwanensis]|nr:hypothetical protein CBM2608_A330013 [Cupriavidus taiwanensis]SOZ80594.1 hypothetical protein CBM2618_A290127 [Cupriavidus taiwanensis]SOZ81848.1 hypothetical protein CBM2622_A270127 [Cupriavidus taiwanensis]SOZ90382.1 hypothetical protein CBM2621_A280031 [Cupriavidus taiwanensis]SPA15689.1 hypothetical protein CBM2631_A330025 [Cupriavidus taiwanensis]
MSGCMITGICRLTQRRKHQGVARKLGFCSGSNRRIAFKLRGKKINQRPLHAVFMGATMQCCFNTFNHTFLVYRLNELHRIQQIACGLRLPRMAFKDSP